MSQILADESKEQKLRKEVVLAMLKGGCDGAYLLTKATTITQFLQTGEIPKNPDYADFDDRV